eukprot:3493326-Pyramimonas_sp.AAC.1
MWIPKGTLKLPPGVEHSRKVVPLKSHIPKGTLKLPPGVEHSRKVVPLKSHIPKVMFLSAVAKSLLMSCLLPGGDVEEVRLLRVGGAHGGGEEAFR